MNTRSFEKLKRGLADKALITCLTTLIGGGLSATVPATGASADTSNITEPLVDIVNDTKSLYGLNETKEGETSFGFDSVIDFTKQAKIKLQNSLLELKNENTVSQNFRIADKIDSLRLKVDDFMVLVAQREEAPSFPLLILQQSKKDYQLDINEVLTELEPILFDGQVINFTNEINSLRQTLQTLEQEKSLTEERLLFAPEEGGLFTKSKTDLKTDLEQLEVKLFHTRKKLDDYQFQLKHKLSKLGIDISREQIDILTTRVDGQNLAQSFALFDVTKQMLQSLQLLMNETEFNSVIYLKYYGILIILMEFNDFLQQQYIADIDDKYLPSLEAIETDVIQTLDFTRETLGEAEDNTNKNLLRTNIEASQTTLDIIEAYRNVLLKQKEKLRVANEKTKERASVAYSSYDTALNAANLIELIRQADVNFDEIFNLQVPEIIEFDTGAMQSIYVDVSKKLREIN